MPDTPSNPGGGRPARPAIPPFRGPAGGAAAGGPVRPAVPPARAPSPPGDRAPGPGGLPPRPAVSPLPPTSARPASRRATPARSPYVTPSASHAPAPAVLPAALTPIVAQPEVLPAPVGAIVPSVSSPSGDPLAGLDVLEPMPAPEAGESPAAGARAAAPGALPSQGADWLSPEGALRGEFGDLVDHIPQRPSAEAPVFPTPPAPWPSLAASVAPVPADAGAAPGTIDDVDAGFEELLGTTPAAAAAAPVAATSPGAAPDLDAWTPESSDSATPAEVSSIPGMHDVSSAESEVWADSYGAQADAIHGDIQPAAVDGARAGAEVPEVPQAGDAASYLAAEWPEPPAVDASTLATPVMPSPAILPGSEPAARMPAAPAPPDPLLDAARQPEEDAFGWGRTPQETPAGDAGAIDSGRGGPASLGGSDEWMFHAASADTDLGGRPVVTPSSLAAAEALERVAAQLREGTLRADGFSPALGEAAALSAVLAALLGIDARWDVHR